MSETPTEYFAPVYHVKDTIVAYHSMVVVMPIAETRPSRFRDVLVSFENQSLWSHFSCDRDGEWVHRGLLMGSFCVVHEGSYMVDLDSEVCLTGVVIYCTNSRLTAKCAVAERSTSADNHHGEILGGMISQISLRTTSRCFSSPRQAIKIYRNNRGVLSHGNNPSCPLPANQAQTDAMRTLKHLAQENTFTSDFTWVEGHVLEHKMRANCTLPERLNDTVNDLAKKVPVARVASQQFIDISLSFKHIHVYSMKDKVTVSLVLSFEEQWGYKTARSPFDKERIQTKDKYASPVSLTLQHDPGTPLTTP